MLVDQPSCMIVGMIYKLSCCVIVKGECIQTIEISGKKISQSYNLLEISRTEKNSVWILESGTCYLSLKILEFELIKYKLMFRNINFFLQHFLLFSNSTKILSKI